MQIHLFYHNPCVDGFTAAWVFWTWNPNIKFYPTTPSWKSLKDFLKTPHEGRLIFVDCCPPPELLDKTAFAGYEITILDHHKSNLEACQAYDFTVFDREKLSDFDMQKSGAGLAWQYCYPNTPAPSLVQHVQDYDLWKFRLSNTSKVIAYSNTLPKTFQNWQKLFDSLRANREDVTSKGAVALALICRNAEELVERKLHFFMINGEKVPAINSPIFQNEISELLLDKYDACLIWHKTPNGYKYSVRSCKVAASGRAKQIALSFGGGGHDNSAGFYLDHLLT